MAQPVKIVTAGIVSRYEGSTHENMKKGINGNEMSHVVMNFSI